VFYQARFADESGRIVGIRRDDLARRVDTTPANLAVRRDYYTIERTDGQLDTGVETTVLGRNVERFAAQALRRIHVAGRFPVTRQDKEDIGLFLAFQTLRGPDHRERADEFTQRALATVADMMADEAIAARLVSGGNPAPTAEDIADVREGIHDRKTFKLALGTNHHVRTMLEVAPDLVRYFSLRTWTLVCFPPPSLLTSDVPVVLSSGGGLMTADEIIVAIDPGHALLMTHPGGGERIVSGTEDMARQLNCRSRDSI
jgi:hypothetical protein